jgi:signal transduction histidine kinase
MSDLLDYNKIMKKEFEPKVTQFVLTDCINAIAHIMVPLCEARKNVIKIDYSKDLPNTVFSDYNRL